ncbi:hypothetical protein B296_00041881 [Ensete ventricosum]|uniref:Uncharacterized protein n=1 Tax=Ensete ventricosum TaxID=4639 RepID=A0A426Y720_ENSVE|nr:hypothetical protein B296_00041881 [Ensete ventricosum]
MGGIPTRSVRRNVECRRPCMMCTSSPPPGGNVTCETYPPLGVVRSRNVPWDPSLDQSETRKLIHMEADRSDLGIGIGGVLLGEIPRRRSRGLGWPPRAIVGDDYEVICFDFSSADSLSKCDFDRAGVLFQL